MARPTIWNLLVLAAPVVVSRATQTIVGLTDAWMVSHLGEAALAATTTGATNSFLILILPMGTAFIIQSFASQLHGKGDATGARRFTNYGLLIAAATQLVAFASLPLIEPTLSLFPYETPVHTAMSDYLFWRILSSGPAVALEAIGAYYGGVGRTHVPMVANVGAMILNIALNAILIDGRLGAPALGVTGAAIASTVSTTFAFIGLFIYLRSEGTLGRPRLEELKRTLRFGGPSGLNWFFEFLAYNVFVNFVVAGLGTTALAALMAVMQINTVSFMPAFGISSAGGILVGQAIGADDRDDVPRIVRMTFGTAASWQVLVGVAYVLVPSVIFAPFASDPASRDGLLRLGVQMLMLSAGWQLFDAAAMAFSESLRAAGDTVWPLAARLTIAWLAFVPGSWLSIHTFALGEIAAIGWLIAYMALLALALVLRFRSGKWRTFEMTEPEAG